MEKLPRTLKMLCPQKTQPLLQRIQRLLPPIRLCQPRIPRLSQPKQQIQQLPLQTRRQRPNPQNQPIRRLIQQHLRQTEAA
jgi:hypothetical protein